MTTALYKLKIDDIVIDFPIVSNDIDVTKRQIIALATQHTKDALKEGVPSNSDVICHLLRYDAWGHRYVTVETIDVRVDIPPMCLTLEDYDHQWNRIDGVHLDTPEGLRKDGKMTYCSSPYFDSPTSVYAICHKCGTVRASSHGVVDYYVTGYCNYYADSGLTNIAEVANVDLTDNPRKVYARHNLAPSEMKYELKKLAGFIGDDRSRLKAVKRHFKTRIFTRFADMFEDYAGEHTMILYKCVFYAEAFTFVLDETETDLGQAVDEAEIWIESHLMCDKPTDVKYRIGSYDTTRRYYRGVFSGIVRLGA